MNNNKENHSQTQYLTKRVKTLEEENAIYKEQIKWYEEQFRLLQKQKFGSSSEKTSDPNQLELPLFNEAEVTATPEAEEPSEEIITYVRKKKGRTSSDSVSQLPVEVVSYTLPEEEQKCSSCSNSIHEMKVETRREIEIIPASAFIREHRRSIYSCRHCEKNNIETPIKEATAPEPVLFKSMASPSAVAHIMSQKYVEGLPLYRQEQQFKRINLNLSRQTMSNWMIQTSELWLEPMYKCLKAYLLKEPEMHVDETTVQVLKEKDRKASSKSFMWLYRSGREGLPCVLFDYQTTRASKHPKRFLDGYDGTLQVDGYQGYNGLPGVQLSGCWAHTRRKFDEAAKAGNIKNTSDPTLSQQGVSFINQLYKIERSLKGENPDKILSIRQKQSLEIVDAFFVWVKKHRNSVPPKSLLGMAFSYAISQEKKLRVPFENGRLDIDNNRAERSIKPFVIGRKNWLFSQSMKGARASAVIYSIIETAKENNLRPFEYLKYLFEELPSLNKITDDILEPFLPWSQTLPDHIKINSSY